MEKNNELFDRIIRESTQSHLTEKLVNGTKNELQRLVIQAKNNKLLHHNLYTKIKNTPFRYLSSDKNVLEYPLFDIMEFIIEKQLGVSFFIENKEDKIIAFISYYENENDPSIIDSVKVANLYMVDKDKRDKDYRSEDENGDVLHDSLELVGKLLKEYKEVNFSASIYNVNAIKIYDLFFKRHKGDPKNRVPDGNEINWKLFQEANP